MTTINEGGSEVSIEKNEPALSTQEQNPRRAVSRTMLQTAIPAFIALLVIVPEIIEVVLDGLGQHMPSEVYLWLTGLAALITAVSGVIARVMAIPGVVDWLSKYATLFAPASDARHRK
jgi:hypothetical protein